MNAKPILFQGDMVRAILDGRKTQTRRVAKDAIGDATRENPLPMDKMKNPVGKVGNLLWVRETFDPYLTGKQENPNRLYARVEYKCDGNKEEKDITPETKRKLDTSESKSWTPPIHMPRWASRITLKITDVRVERVQDISGPDCCAEGIQFNRLGDGPPLKGNQWKETRKAFAQLWNSINTDTPHCWEDNPWVWAITFEPIFENIDEILAKEAT